MLENPIFSQSLLFLRAYLLATDCTTSLGPGYGYVNKKNSTPGLYPLRLTSPLVSQVSELSCGNMQHVRDLVFLFRPCLSFPCWAKGLQFSGEKRCILCEMVRETTRLPLANLPLSPSEFCSKNSLQSPSVKIWPFWHILACW